MVLKNNFLEVTYSWHQKHWSHLAFSIESYTVRPPYFAILYFANLPYSRYPCVPQKQEEEKFRGLSTRGTDAQAQTPPSVS